MLHDEYIRIVPGAKTAVLMIHGICGTPNHFRGLLPLQDLVPEWCSIYNIALDGHCKEAEDFSKTSMRKWKDQVWRVFAELSESHEQVIMVAHSMGTLFSIQLALEHPEKIPFMFLLAVPLRVRVRLFGVTRIMRYAFGRLDMSKPQDAAMLQVCGVIPTKQLWRYIPWFPRMIELIKEMHFTAKLIPNLSVPAVAYQSDPDEMVSNRSKRILEQNDKIEVRVLNRSTHYYYHADDIPVLRQDFAEVLRQFCK